MPKTGCDRQARDHGRAPAYVEKLLGNSADRQQVRLLKGAHDQRASEVAAKKSQQARHASLPERIACLERMMGDSADKHTKEHLALKDAHAKHATGMEPHLTSMRRWWSA